MNNKKYKIKLIAVLFLVFSLCGCKFDFKNDFSKMNLNSCHEGNKIKKKNWIKIQIGMNKAELNKMLGSPLKESVVLVNGNIKYEYWEYEYSGGGFLMSSDKINFIKYIKEKDHFITIYSLNDEKESEAIVPCIKAYTVFFDKEEKIISMKKPRLELFKSEFKENNWKKLETGMNKGKVIFLLGTPLSITKNPKLDNDNYYEFWEYKNTKELIMPIPSTEAFVVTFDKNGLLKLFLSPNVQ